MRTRVAGLLLIYSACATNYVTMVKARWRKKARFDMEEQVICLLSCPSKPRRKSQTFSSLREEENGVICVVAFFFPYQN